MDLSVITDDANEQKPKLNIVYALKEQRSQDDEFICIYIWPICNVHVNKLEYTIRLISSSYNSYNQPNNGI